MNHRTVAAEVKWRDLLRRQEDEDRIRRLEKAFPVDSGLIEISSLRRWDVTSLDESAGQEDEVGFFSRRVLEILRTPPAEFADCLSETPETGFRLKVDDFEALLAEDLRGRRITPGVYVGEGLSDEPSHTYVALHTTAGRLLFKVPATIMWMLWRKRHDVANLQKAERLSHVAPTGDLDWDVLRSGVQWPT